MTVALFRRRSSTHEDADPGAVAEVVELCGYLPLVIKMSAARHARTTTHPEGNHVSDVTNVKSAVQGSTETIAVAEVIETARGLGVQRLPHVDRLVTGRVWPGGQGWVGEVGEGQNIRALDDMYESMVEAIKP